MAARIDVGDSNEQTIQIILDFLSSSSSSDDDDYLLSNEKCIVPKIQNFLGVVHNFSENVVSFYIFRLHSKTSSTRKISLDML